jgi:hypothetical protein
LPEFGFHFIFVGKESEKGRMRFFLNIFAIRKTFLLTLCLFVPVICSAPVIDFRLNLQKFRVISKEADRKFHESEFIRFINDLGYRESGNNWLSINRIGCFGEWQFAESTLKYLGFRKITLRRFRANPFIFPRELQAEALRSLIRVNMIYLKDHERYIGTTIRGIRVTRSGMIAASHLGGAGSMKKFLDSGGRINRKDTFGTAVSEYLKRFSSYDID